MVIKMCNLSENTRSFFHFPEKHLVVLFMLVVVQKLDILLSSEENTIQQISIGKTNCVIYWIVIYPVDSTICLLNNWSQVYMSVKSGKMK